MRFKLNFSSACVVSNSDLGAVDDDTNTDRKQASGLNQKTAALPLFLLITPHESPHVSIKFYCFTLRGCEIDTNAFSEQKWLCGIQAANYIALHLGKARSPFSSHRLTHEPTLYNPTVIEHGYY